MEWTPPAPTYAGSIPVGSTYYQIPEGVVLYVSPNGNNALPGTLGAPKRTLAGAVRAAPAGATVVLREGVYHEPVNVTKQLTVQAYPGEAVWLDGSTVYTSWTGSGPWTSPLGPRWSPLSTAGFPLTTDPQGNLPEQVWINDVAQRQVADGARPAAGQFSVDRNARTVTVGTDPAGKTVRVADLNNAIVFSAKVSLRGIGFRRYSPITQEGLSSIVYFGGTSQGSVVENCVFQESSHTGVNTSRAIIMRNVTIQDCGGTGLQVTTANGLILERFVIRRCNRSLWKAQPHTAGIKITRTEGLLIRDGIITDVPGAMGLWLDVSVTRSTVINVDVDGSTAMPAPPMEIGIHSELSDGGFYGDVQHHSWYVNCRVRNAKVGIKFLDAGWTNIVNCEIKNYSSVGVYLQQDERRNTGQSGNLSPAIVPWVGRGTGLINNDIGQGGLQVIAYHDPPTGSPLLRGWDFFSRVEGNWFRPAPPGSMIQLGKADGRRNSYNTLAALASTPSTVGSSVGKLGTNHQGVITPSHSVAAPISAELSRLIGVPEGLRRVGPFLPAPTTVYTPAAPSVSGEMSGISPTPASAMSGNMLIYGELAAQM